MSRITRPIRTQGNAPSHSPPDMQYAPGNQLARALGWFSVGLGMAELVAPSMLGKLTGVERVRLVQAYGIRELICGAGILVTGRPTGWLWARIAGDVLDLATLGEAYSETDTSKRYRIIASAAAVSGVTILDVISSSQMHAASKLEG